MWVISRLVAILIYRRTTQDNLKNIEIVLLEFSTGKPHPQAHLPRLFVKKSQWIHPSVSIGVVGDTLALLTAYYDNESRPEDDIYIFDWKAGVLKMVSSHPVSHT